MTPAARQETEVSWFGRGWLPSTGSKIRLRHEKLPGTGNWDCIIDTFIHCLDTRDSSEPCRDSRKTSVRQWNGFFCKDPEKVRSIPSTAAGCTPNFSSKFMNISAFFRKPIAADQEVLRKNTVFFGTSPYTADNEPRTFFGVHPKISYEFPNSLEYAISFLIQRDTHFQILEVIP